MLPSDIAQFEWLLMLIALLVVYVLGYWHGSRIGALQSIRSLMGMQHRTSHPLVSQVVPRRLPSRTRSREVGNSSDQDSMMTLEEARIIELFVSGTNASGIVATLYGIDMTAGKLYMDKMAYVQGVIRSDLQYYHGETGTRDIED
jgi:hypothetical protein